MMHGAIPLLHDYLSHSAGRLGDKVALVCGGQRLTYAEIEARLALGQTGADALRPFLRSIFRSAIGPQIEQTAALGIVFLPGAMTGLVLAGVDPVDAVRTQLALMYVILAGVAVTTIATTLGAARRLVTADDRLLPVARQRT